MKSKKWIWSFFSFFLLVALDQWTKHLAVVNLKGNTPISLIDGVLELRYLENQGAAFGIFQNLTGFLTVFTFLVLLIILWFFTRIPDEKRYFPLQIVCVFIIAGAIGNLIDRMMHGYVVDFIYFKLIDFPIFNVADCYVTITFVLLLILILFVYKEEELERLLPKKKA